MYHYDPLKRHLAAQDQDRISMSYEDIERLLGRALPPSAKGKHSQQWWANTQSHSQAKAWLANSRKAKLGASGDTVTFTKVQTVKLERESDVIHLRRDQLHPAALRLIADVAEEKQVGAEEATAAILNQSALRRRRETLEGFARNTSPSSQSSVDLIRADRDAR